MIILLENKLNEWGLWMSNGKILRSEDVAALYAVECYGVSPNKSGSKALIDDSIESMNEHIETLPAKQKDAIFVEYSSSGLKTMRESAERAQMSINAYRINLHRARKSLKSSTGYF